MSWLFSEERRALRARIALERETRRQIGQMSDHMLKDIGVYYDECSDRFTPRPLDTSTSL